MNRITIKQQFKQVGNVRSHSKVQVCGDPAGEYVLYEEAVAEVRSVMREFTELFKMLRDAPDEGTRMRCIKSSIETFGE